MGSLGRELQQAVVSQRYGLSSGSSYFQAQDTLMPRTSFLCLLIFTGRYVPLLISVESFETTAYALSPSKRRAKLLKIDNIEQNITGCLYSA